MDIIKKRWHQSTTLRIVIWVGIAGVLASIANGLGWLPDGTTRTIVTVVGALLVAYFGKEGVRQGIRAKEGDAYKKEE